MFSTPTGLSWSEHTPGAAHWTTPQEIVTKPGGASLFNPAIGVTPDGTTIVTWGYSGTAHTEYARVRPAGGSWGTVATLDPAAGTTAQDYGGFGRMAVDAAGTVTILWLQGGQTLSKVEAVRWTAAGGFEAPQTVTSWDPNLYGDLAFGLGVGDDGRPAAAWVQTSGISAFYLGTARGNADGTWQAPQGPPSATDSAIGVYPHANSSGAAVAVRPDGTAIAAWGRRQSDADGLRVAAAPAGAGFGAAADGPALLTNATVQPVLAPVGDAVMAIVLDGQHVRLLRSAAGTTFDMPVDLAPSDQPLGAGAVLAGGAVNGDRGGDALAAWTRSDGTHIRIEARFLDATPPVLDFAGSPPASGAPGAALHFAATATDAIGGPAAITYDFGDGTPPATGAAVDHAFARPGSYDVTVTATDAAGNATTRKVPVVIATTGEPSPTPTPRPATPPAKPTAASVISLPPARSCVSRRRIVLHLHAPTGLTVRSLTIAIGKQVRRPKPRGSAPIVLAGLPKGRYTVAVTVDLSDGTKLRLVRRYKTCAPKRRR
jgi:hypothetical protein